MRRRAKKHPLVEKVFNIIVRTEPPEFGDLTVKNIAKKLKVSTGHLSRVFKKEYGYTIQYTIIVYKVMRAKMMLDEGMPIKQVVYLTGCCHESHLARLFKKVCPYTPGQYCQLTMVVRNLGKLYRKAMRKRCKGKEN
ncbi:MAG: AraC family transcriptional regulator [Candidatus Aminicenantes bacterium]|nr:AraC family transcriptional regulator [Candidatus Aminicenantes bacterium]NIM83260.1 AraC family transcriptional regulator [Candidatus Aminicenantes bacterium]NIN22631.1 AraC family transcriptional regulator [Candidatus Aminicenantes bacterium]NIN46390.1 AraC family transcriptional regulator [Candidatus Aminicenantes bacterium]NIN89240.1 AraC family transcriptional regulator [Candidatus Aminicenantes bacterium]